VLVCSSLESIKGLIKSRFRNLDSPRSIQPHDAHVAKSSSTGDVIRTPYRLTPTRRRGLLCSGIAGRRADHQAQQVHKHFGILTDFAVASRFDLTPCVRAFNRGRTPTFGLRQLSCQRAVWDDSTNRRCFRGLPPCSFYYQAHSVKIRTHASVTHQPD
jgi:hypothetical protein